MGKDNKGKECGEDQRRQPELEEQLNKLRLERTRVLAEMTSGTTVEERSHDLWTQITGLGRHYRELDRQVKELERQLRRRSPVLVMDVRNERNAAGMGPKRLALVKRLIANEKRLVKKLGKRRGTLREAAKITDGYGPGEAAYDRARRDIAEFRKSKIST